MGVRGPCHDLSDPPQPPSSPQLFKSSTSSLWKVIADMKGATFALVLLGAIW